MRIALTTIFLAFLFILSTGLPERAGATPVAVDYESAGEAKRLFLEGKWREAVEAYEEIEEPTASDLNRLGDARFFRGDLEGAAEAYGKSLKLQQNEYARISLLMVEATDSWWSMRKLKGEAEDNPENPLLWRALGLATRFESGEEEALPFFQKTVELDPEDYISWFHIGVIYEHHHAYDLGIEAYREAVDLNPHYAQAVNNLGYCYKERRYYTYAIEEYKKAIAIDSDNSGFHYNIGNAYTHKGMIREAYKAYQRALALDPTFAKAHYNMARSHVRMGEYRDALKEFKLYQKFWTPDIPVRDAPPPEYINDEIEFLEDNLRRLEAGRFGDEEEEGQPQRRPGQMPGADRPHAR